MIISMETTQNPKRRVTQKDSHTALSDSMWTNHCNPIDSLDSQGVPMPQSKKLSWKAMTNGYSNPRAMMNPAGTTNM